MSSLKCPKCGLVNFAGSVACKRCQAVLSILPSNPPVQPRFRLSTQTLPVQFSFYSVVKNDYGALLSLITPLLSWGLFIAISAFNSFGLFVTRRGRDLPPEMFLYIAIVATVLGIPLLVWRFHAFKQVFTNGENTFGRITSISFFKDRGRIEYSYISRGQTYKSGNAIMKNRQTEYFRDGDEIELVIDRSNPKRAFIKTLYTRSSTIRL